MNLKTYRAADMRTALNEVRAQQGPDAVIVATRRVDGGVEVVAAVDYDAAAVAAAAPPPVEVAASVAPAPRVPVPPEPRGSDHGELGNELRDLRQVLEHQVAVLAWNDFTRREPLKAAVLGQLTALGIGRDLAREIVAELPTPLAPERARSLPYALLAARISTGTPEWMQQGQVGLFVGSTGVGKSTLLAKVAVNWMLAHGPASLTLISTDTSRLGAAEQFGALGRLLGVRALTAVDAQSLATLVRRHAEHSLVLVDTEGCATRDAAAVARLQQLRAAVPDAHACLVLSAAAQGASLAEAHALHARMGLAGLALTKLDESVTLGGAITLLASNDLPLHWITDGPRIPEDLKPARPLDLISRAVELAKQSDVAADEDLLARRHRAPAGQRVSA